MVRIHVFGKMFIIPRVRSTSAISDISPNTSDFSLTLQEQVLFKK